MIVGIDLGTTNSAVAVWRDDGPQLIPNALGDLLTPSAVSVVEDGSVLVGMPARDRQVTRPEASATAFKRLMGTRQTATLGSVTFTPEDLSALILRNLKADVEAHTGETVTGAVITVPAYYNDRQRQATKRAGELAGLPVARLLNEPTAAALAFGVADDHDHEPFLVFDLGGGTFDVSIVEKFDGIVEVRSSAGDNRLGGEDFNDALIALARSKLAPCPAIDAADPARLPELLRDAAERTRRALSETDPATFAVTIDGTRLETSISEAEFEAQTAGLIARLRDPVLRSLRDSDIRVEGLSEIILVGGATRMPVVRRAITRMFGRFPNTRVHPDHAVALGAAVQAGLLSRDAGLEEFRLTDVCPFTLGVDTAEKDPRGALRTGIFAPIIERNTPIPASRIESFATMNDNQRVVEFGIYQGEARDVEGNVKLGQVRIPLPRGKAGEVEVECRFSYDSSGLLEVDIHVPQSGERRQLTIMDEDDAPTPEELQRRREALAALKIHPRDQAANAALLERGRRAYESFVGERRDVIGQLLSSFESFLDAQDPRTIGAARDDFAQALDAIEGERYL